MKKVNEIINNFIQLIKLTVQVADNDIILLNEKYIAFVLKRMRKERKIFILQHIKIQSETTLLKHIIGIEYRVQLRAKYIFYDAYYCVV